MKRIKIALLSLAAFGAAACGDWIDMVPDNVPTIDMAFKTRTNAEKMLFTCYDYIPDHANPWSTPGIGAGDEVWNCAEKTYYYTNETGFRIAKGLQNTNDPYMNYWSGSSSGSSRCNNLFVGINVCNTFIDNIDRVPDMTTADKARWKAEAKVVKAYLHFWLLQLYGPIPFIEKNIEVSASPEEVKVVREPVDRVAEKIVALIDEALAGDALPLYIRLRDTEMGRITRPAALAIKAKVLATVASPLFNGNGDFAFYKNAEGENLISAEYDPAKWEAARDACREAIESAHEAGHGLYEFDETVNGISDTTRLELTLRHTIIQRYDRELIWGIRRLSTTRDLMGICNAPLTDYQQGQQIGWCKMMHNPTLDVVEQFYTNKGLPIDEDRTWDYEHRYEVAETPYHGHEYYIEKGARTARLHMFREPRFYAWIGFDRGKWFTLEAPSDRESFAVYCKSGERAGRSLDNYSVTGFFTKKMVSYKLVMTQGSHTGEASCHYAFPIVRLADLYLLYAECLNECKEAPDAEVSEYVQKVRDKAGLDRETGSLEQTWAAYAKDPSKPATKEGMREIIRRERMIELSFEGPRFHDLRRWKLCMDYFNRPVRGWDVTATDETFYTPSYIYFRKFTPRDYFWPIRLDDLYKNNKLQQSPLW